MCEQCICTDSQTISFDKDIVIVNGQRETISYADLYCVTADQRNTGSD